MNLVPRLLELVRTLLFGLTGFRRSACAGAPVLRSNAPVSYGTSAVLSARLAVARLRRAPHLWPPAELPAIEDDVIAAGLVRAYLMPEDEPTRRLASPLRGVR